MTEPVRTMPLNISISSAFLWFGRLLVVSVLVFAFFVVPIEGQLSIAAAFVLLLILSFYALRFNSCELIGLGFFATSLSLAGICLGSEPGALERALWLFQPYLSIALFAGGIWAYVFSARRGGKAKEFPQ